MLFIPSSNTLQIIGRPPPTQSITAASKDWYIAVNLSAVALRDTL